MSLPDLYIFRQRFLQNSTRADTLDRDYFKPCHKFWIGFRYVLWPDHINIFNMLWSISPNFSSGAMLSVCPVPKWTSTPLWRLLQTATEFPHVLLSVNLPIISGRFDCPCWRKASPLHDAVTCVTVEMGFSTHFMCLHMALGKLQKGQVAFF